MRAGRLKHPMTLQRPVDTTGADGVVTQTWQTALELWAGKVPVGTRESMFSMDAASISEQVEITIRRKSFPDLTTAYRFKHGAAIYEIAQVVLDDTRDQVWRCLCQRRAL